MRTFKSFASDNNSGVHPEILKAITEANKGHALAYGDDSYTKKADKRFEEHFGKNIDAYFMFNGTAANVLGLKAITNSYNSIICADIAHINTSECNAVEIFTGCKLLTVPSKDGKITVDQVKKQMHLLGEQHHAQPKVISITQATEMGRVYKKEEIKKLADFAHKHGMLLHMDGARLANAAAALNLKLRDITRDAGVDVLSFGGTKNGIMSGEAIIFFNRKRGYSTSPSKGFKYIRKQGMQLTSKMRYISAQFIALLSNDLWLKNARHANKMAKLLEKEIRKIPELKITQKVETNGVFVIIPRKYIKKIQRQYFFYLWNESISEARFMTSFDTTEEDIENFIKAIRGTIK
ncbi:MAG: aminotransferase class I/II-fold pyridoxal phosphate-dependent enzyme [Candidatus Melainabacteria bacterium]|nr:aminotransferase class I/II-fold pyridoxal phosphate-dependent enzyme [Candidatus Melainabacteria bacterium]